MSETKAGYLQPFGIGAGREAYYPPTRVMGVEDCAAGTNLSRLLVLCGGQSGPYAMNVEGAARVVGPYVNELMDKCGAGLAAQLANGARLEAFEEVIVERITSCLEARLVEVTEKTLLRLVPEAVDGHLRAMAAGEPASADAPERSDDIAPRRKTKAKEKAVA